MDEAKGLKQLEEHKNLEAQERLSDLEEEQRVNEALVALPEEWQVNGRTVRVRPKNIRQMVRIDRCILELQKLAYAEVEGDPMDPGFLDQLAEKNEQVYNLVVDILFEIINEDPDNPEFDKDWIAKSFDMTETGQASEIIDAYNRLSSPSSLLKKILLSRKF